MHTLDVKSTYILYFYGYNHLDLELNSTSINYIFILLYLVLFFQPNIFIDYLEIPHNAP